MPRSKLCHFKGIRQFTRYQKKNEKWREVNYMSPMHMQKKNEW